MKITSNYHKRLFLFGYEVPEEIHEDYDHLPEDEHGDNWIKYNENYYHISDFMKYDDEFWNGYVGDSFFSGVLIHIDDEDTETYVIGWYVN